MGGGGGGGDGEPEFQIAPMIDVLLTLLIFFMSITSSQVEQLDKDIKLPVAPDAKERKPNKLQAIVNLKMRDAKPIMMLNKQEFSDPEELQKAMEAFVNDRAPKGSDKEGKAELLIRGDMMVPAKEISKVMQVAGIAGIDTISFSTFNQ